MRKKLILGIFSFLVVRSVLFAHPGIGLVADSNGIVYYTDLEHVWKIDLNGQVSKAVKNVHTHELYIDEKNNLYGEHTWYEGEATDKWGYYIWKLNADGTIEYPVPETEGFPTNNTLVRNRKGHQFWQKKIDDHDRIYKTLPNGDQISATNTIFEDVRWLYFNQHNNSLLVVDMLSLKEITANGTVNILVSDLKQGRRLFNMTGDRHYVMAPYTDADNSIFIALFGASKVVKVLGNNRFETFIESPSGWAPTNGLIDNNKNHWILEYSNRNKARVRKIQSDGSEIIYKGD